MCWTYTLYIFYVNNVLVCLMRRKCRDYGGRRVIQVDKKCYLKQWDADVVTVQWEINENGCWKLGGRKQGLVFKVELGSKANVEMSQTVLVRRKMKEPFDGEGYVKK